LVWNALVNQINEWWLPDFRMMGADSVVSCDASAGGLLSEADGAGGSLLWYTIIMSQPEKALHLVGHLGPDWGGPATSMLTLKLVEATDHTLLHVEDHLYGDLEESTIQSLEAGWKSLFTQGLKVFVEGLEPKA
jgi:hypothetical protein